MAKLSMQDILNLFKHDAVHDSRHETYDQLGVKTQILSAAPLALGSAESSRRSTPPVMERTVGANRVKEDAVYGRRW